MDTLLQGLRAAAEPTRLRVLGLCDHADLSVNELVEILGQSQPRVSRHLKLLVSAGLLERNQEGTRVYYRRAVDTGCAELGRILVDLLPHDDPGLVADLNRLEEIKRKRMERAEAYFLENAENWEDLRGLYVDDQEIDKQLQSLILAEPAQDLLDIGTGTGRVLELVGDQVTSAIGIDKSRPMLDVARANIDRLGFKNCQVRLADMYRLPFAANSFDVVTIHMCMRYAEAPDEVVSEASRVLRPSGRLILVDFAPHDLRELRDEHAHRWLGFENREMIDLLKRAGLKAEKPKILEGDPLTVCLWTGRAADVANDTEARVGGKIG